MAEVVLSVVIEKAVVIVATLLVEKSSRLYRWRKEKSSQLDKLEKDIRWLEQRMRLLQADLQAAEKKVTNPMVETFIKGIRDLASDVKDIFDIFLPQIREHESSGFFKRITRTDSYFSTCSMFSEKIKEINERVEQIQKDKTNYSIPDDPPEESEAPNVDPRTTKLDVDDYLIVGFDEHIEKVKTKLKNHRFVTIVGMRGLGKTTLAKKVFNGVKGGFECAASIVVSQDPKIYSLWRDIATQVGLEKEKQDQDVESNLKSLLQEKRYILLLDDIWSTHDWDILGECFPDNSGSRIIVTSQNTNVGRYKGREDSLYFLDTFDDTTSWELFSKLIIPFFNIVEEFERSELKKIGEKIVKKCGGVPLAIVVVVGLLRQREKSEYCWNDVLNNIGHDTKDKCFQTFSLSYIDLPSALKPCYLYLGSFPKDYKYSAFKLIRMWVAEELVKDNRGRDLEDVGKSYISELDSRNLIKVVEREIDGRVKKFRVHDKLYDICVAKGRECDFLRTVDRLDFDFARKVRRLGVFGDYVLEDGMPKIHGLLDFEVGTKTKEKKLKRVLSKSRLLSVLIFQSTLSRFHLPTSVGSLSLLNYLQIRSPYIKIPPSIQNLKKLETLIVDSSMVKIPVGIWMMKQLKHFHLNSNICKYRKSDYYLKLQPFRQVQVSLPNIQTLHLPYLSQTRPTCSRILPKFTTLRKLLLKEVKRDTMEVLCGREPISNNLETLHCGEVIDCDGMRMNLSKYGMLSSLTIGSFYGLDFQHNGLPPSLIKVKFGGCKISISIMATLRRLPKLKILQLVHCYDLGRSMDFSGGFLQLEFLKLVELYDVDKLIEGEGEEMGMPKLRQLVIQDCRYLKIIPERLQQLPAHTN